MDELNEMIDQALVSARKLRAFSVNDQELFKLSESVVQRLLQIQEKVERVLPSNISRYGRPDRDIQPEIELKNYVINDVVIQ